MSYWSILFQVSSHLLLYASLETLLDGAITSIVCHVYQANQTQTKSTETVSYYMQFLHLHFSLRNFCPSD